MLDLFDERHEGIGNLVHCTRWRAVITGLPEGRYALTVRHMETGGTLHLMARALDTRAAMAVAVPRP